MKVYIAGNLDGDNRAMVAARNMKEAAKLFGTSCYELRNYGCHQVTDPALREMALGSPGTVFYKALSWPSEWRTTRHSQHDRGVAK